MDYQIYPGERMGQEVLMAVSEAENKPMKNLPPLSEVVDLDALNELFENKNETDDNGHVTFVYSESNVSIDYTEQIHVEPRDDQTNLDSDTDDAESLKGTIDSTWLTLNRTDSDESEV